MAPTAVGKVYVKHWFMYRLLHRYGFYLCIHRRNYCSSSACLVFFKVMYLEKGYSLDPKAALPLRCEVGKVRDEKYSFLHRCLR